MLQQTGNAGDNCLICSERDRGEELASTPTERALEFGENDVDLEPAQTAAS